MENQIISPLYDFAFAEIFGNQRNIDITAAFLKTILDIPEDEYDKLTVVSPILRRFYRKDEMGIVDLLLNTKSGKVIHVELQLDKTSDMKNRVLYYMARLIGDQLRWGDDYNKLHQVVSIVICDHNMLEEESSYISEYELRNKYNRSFTKMLKLVILELPKLTEQDDSAVWRWLKFLKCNKEEEFEMLANEYPELQKPIVTVKKMSLLEKWRMIRFHKNLWKVDERMRKKYIQDEATAKGLEQGRKQGLAEGRAELRKTAKNLVSMGLSFENIAKAMEISIEELQDLLT